MTAECQLYRGKWWEWKKKKTFVKGGVRTHGIKINFCNFSITEQTKKHL